MVVTIASAPRIARGIDRCGSRTSSPAVETTNEPTATAISACGERHVWPPLADPQAIRAEIERQVMPELLQIGNGAGTVLVGLRSTGECLARELFSAYGPKVVLSVGLLPFPLRPNPNGGC